jgi:hypothetical protein
MLLLIVAYLYIVSLESVKNFLVSLLQVSLVRLNLQVIYLVCVLWIIQNWILLW